MEHKRANSSRAIADHQQHHHHHNNNNNNNRDHQPVHNNNHNNTMEVSSLRTLRMVESRRRPRRGSCRAQCVFYDRTYPGYDWLLPGWIAEERHMDHGRLYKYFYDPRGNRYNSKNEVLYAWEESGLVILDD